MPRDDKFGHEKSNRKDAARRALNERASEPQSGGKGMADDEMAKLWDQINGVRDAFVGLHQIGPSGDKEKLQQHLVHISENKDTFLPRPHDVLRSFDLPIGEWEKDKGLLIKDIPNQPKAVLQFVALLADQFPDSAIALWQQKNDEAGIVKTTKDGFKITLTPAQYMEIAKQHEYDAMQKLPPMYKRTWEKVNRPPERGINE